MVTTKANREDIALMAHLMRRAGFSETRAEIERLVEQGYEETVEQLLDPEAQPDIDIYTLGRYHPWADNPTGTEHHKMAWTYRMVMTQRPLQEKVALFWHHVFATGNAKVENPDEMTAEIELFRERGMGNYRDLLVALAKNPAMIRWLDNNDNHKRANNENWARELMELFSLGVGFYTEEDVKEAARAFTGWTYGPGKAVMPWRRYPWFFEYKAEDHDARDKDFLGHTGNFNGEDIIDVIVRQPACARFIARHLYNFFVADETQVPAWPFEPPRDPEAIDTLADTIVTNGHEMKPVLRTLFNSDFFKEAKYKRVMSPAEVIVGALKLSGDMNGPDPRWGELDRKQELMGQAILDPPSVEGWHTGKEWINSGALINRVNFLSERVTDTSLPGVKAIIERIAASNGKEMSPETMLDECLDQMGPLEVSEETRAELLEQALGQGALSWETQSDYETSSRRVADMLALIVGTREYQFG